MKWLLVVGTFPVPHRKMKKKTKKTPILRLVKALERYYTHAHNLQCQNSYQLESTSTALHNANDLVMVHTMQAVPEKRYARNRTGSDFEQIFLA